MFIFLLMVCSNLDGQKSMIDLLPSDQKQIHKEAFIDTAIIHDSVKLVSPDTVKHQDGTRILKKTEKRKVGISPGTSISALISIRIRPPRLFIFYITALKR